ncbi:CoA transferase [Oerskovia flava]|uniref:CoA transferase n=1 Tax=Oerskovia flava TaxID=2986422 RepID=UPI00223F792A|nr:CoA transferase [Oerskovia sp. JB1-3-2]
MDAWPSLLAEYEDATGAARTPLPRVAPAPPGLLAATLPVLGLALGSVAALETATARARAAAAPARGRTTDVAPRAVLDPERVAAAFAGDRLLRVGGEPVDGFAPMSGFFRTRDGWVRTHANYPHHRTRLLDALGLPDGATSDQLVAHLGRWSAQDVEDAAAARGAVAVRVRTEDEWRRSAPGRAAASGPLVRWRVRTGGRAGGGPVPLLGGTAPLTGVRVLDLTRVIAGPVATRALARLGADVLRVDPPHLLEIELQHRDTGQGKRSTLLDLRTPADHGRAQELLDRADVLVTGYRPGSVESLGLRPPAACVLARVSAWGDGPWGGRRGFDSIVQAASGVALVESPDGERPGALPAQALDHASGYLLAAAVTDALTARALDGRGRDVAVTLARTGAWLLDAAGRDPAHAAPVAPGPRTVVEHRVPLDGREQVLTTARPAVVEHDDYGTVAGPWGADEARWR